MLQNGKYNSRFQSILGMAIFTFSLVIAVILSVAFEVPLLTAEKLFFEWLFGLFKSSNKAERPKNN